MDITAQGIMNAFDPFLHADYGSASGAEVASNGGPNPMAIVLIVIGSLMLIGALVAMIVMWSEKKKAILTLKKLNREGKTPPTNVKTMGNYRQGTAVSKGG